MSSRWTVIWRGRKRAIGMAALRNELEGIYQSQRQQKAVAGPKAIATIACACYWNESECVRSFGEETSLILPLARLRALRSGAASGGRSLLRGGESIHPKQAARMERKSMPRDRDEWKDLRQARGAGAVQIGAKFYVIGSRRRETVGGGRAGDCWVRSGGPKGRERAISVWVRPSMATDFAAQAFFGSS